MGAACSTDKAVEIRPNGAVGDDSSALSTKIGDSDVSSQSTPCSTIAPRKRRGPAIAETSPPCLLQHTCRKVVQKTAEVKDRIRGAIKHSFILTDLDDEQKSALVDAMFEKPVEAGEVIIREAEQGDTFFVIESGIFAACIKEKRVFVYEGKGAFGELALMYNCPRAATVQAATTGVLWGLDRSTFRSIVVPATMSRRLAYDGILSGMSIFASLTPENRAAIADCLTPQVFQEGEYILREGEELGSDAKFYLIDSGAVHCYKTFEGTKRLVKVLGEGSFFGEVALINHAPRAADCIASGKLKVLFLARDAFERLMGPVESVLAERIREYAAANLATNAQLRSNEENAKDKDAAPAAQASSPARSPGLALSDIENTVTRPEAGDPDAPREYDDDVVLHGAPSPVKPAELVKPISGARRTLGTVDY